MSQEFIHWGTLSQNFPFLFRPGQEETLQAVCQALNDPKIRYIVIQAPAGTGKSPIALSLAKSVSNCYVLTATKLLQDQYLNDFGPFLADLRGHENYKCLANARCHYGNAPCQKSANGHSKCKFIKECPYLVSVDQGARAPITSMNFLAALSFLNHVPLFTQRDIIIVDEAHLLENAMTSFLEFNLTLGIIKTLRLIDSYSDVPNSSNVEDHKEWLEKARKKGAKTLADWKAGNLQAPSSNATINDFEKIMTKLEFFFQSGAFPNNIVIDYTENDRFDPKVNYISIKPIDVSSYTQEYLFRHSSKTVMMSATIVDFSEFIKSMGISSKECACIDVPSTFPPEKRPIIKSYVGKLNHSNINESIPKIINAVETIIEAHPDEKGIIHTHSYVIAQEIHKVLKKEYGKRLLFPATSKEQPTILAKHFLSKEPTILISPSMTEGVDLKDDYSRFQIIVKIPYPPMMDSLVKAKMARDKAWYQWRTLITIIQAYGRSIRSETDHAVTYILDENFENLLRFNSRILPSWFKDAIK